MTKLKLYLICLANLCLSAANLQRLPVRTRRCSGAWLPLKLNVQSVTQSAHVSYSLQSEAMLVTVQCTYEHMNKPYIKIAQSVTKHTNQSVIVAHGSPTLITILKSAYLSILTYCSNNPSITHSINQQPIAQT